MPEVIKRNGEKVAFDRGKIVIAIEKAMHSSSGVYIEDQALEIAKEIEELANSKGLPLSIYDIEGEVYYRLIQNDNPATARAYESYKSVQQYKREQNTTDEDILGLLNETNEDLMDENSNKNAVIASTQRDLIAGEVSKDIAKRKMIPADLVEAHESGAIHIHDMDYFIQPIFNCCLVNMKDMLDNGTVVNGKMIETPKSFQVACNVMTQIIAQIASNQYGGQSINISCLGKYLRRSYEKNLSLALDTLGDIELAEKMANQMTKKDLESG
ncbi:MAG: anaerobic ribonucleoside-triphosphate reductase, partial [Peptoniphilus harei]|nr:anaerobic ribonucleoside-triphosphate reductase [Peptoniphilus harei]